MLLYKIISKQKNQIHAIWGYKDSFLSHETSSNLFKCTPLGAKYQSFILKKHFKSNQCKIAPSGANIRKPELSSQHLTIQTPRHLGLRHLASSIQLLIGTNPNHNHSDTNFQPFWGEFLTIKIQPISTSPLWSPTSSRIINPANPTTDNQGR